MAQPDQIHRSSKDIQKPAVFTETPSDVTRKGCSWRIHHPMKNIQENTPNSYRGSTVSTGTSENNSKAVTGWWI